MTLPDQAPLQDLLLAMDWVQALSEEARDKVLTDCHDKVHAPKEYIAQVGEPATSWLGVGRGLVKISTAAASGKSLLFTAASDSAWFGEGSVIKGEARRYDLVAIRPTRMVYMPRKTFMSLLDTSREFSRFIIDHLNERVGQSLSMLESSRLTNPDARIAAAVCNLFNDVLYPKAGPLIRMSQEELGEVANMSRSSTSTALSTLRKLKLVHVEYGAIHVLDLPGLRQFAFSNGTPPAPAAAPAG